MAVVLVGRNQLDRAGALYQLSSEMFGRVVERPDPKQRQHKARDTAPAPMATWTSPR